MTFVGLVALTWSFVVVGGTLLIILVALFLAIVLAPVVDKAQRRLDMGRGAASSPVVLGLAALIALLMLIVLSPMIDEIGKFADAVPKIVDDINNSDIGRQLDIHSRAKEALQQNAAKIVGGIGNAAGGVLGVTVSAFGVFVMAFSVIFMTLFLVKDLPSYRQSLLGLMGNASAARWENITDEIITTTSRYMLGNILISIVCAAIYGATALILGPP